MVPFTSFYQNVLVWYLFHSSQCIISFQVFLPCTFYMCCSKNLFLWFLKLVQLLGVTETLELFGKKQLTTHGVESQEQREKLRVWLNGKLDSSGPHVRPKELLAAALGKQRRGKTNNATKNQPPLPLAPLKHS